VKQLPAIDRANVLTGFNVSRETATNLDILVAEMERWQKIKNLVGPSAMSEIWSRHIADSLQLNAFVPSSGQWLDLGSGGGFPGLVLAMVRTEQKLGTVHLLESNGRKCAFLRHIVLRCGLDATVHEGRIEDLLPKFAAPVTVVSARALAPLSQLMGWSNGLLRNGALGIFPKGQDVDIELEEASISWAFTAQLHQSKTDLSGKIVLVRMSAT
jgi:16S rRNA (guanine527-N7)-methyltransferase